jgi:hypothetical protein
LIPRFGGKGASRCCHLPFFHDCSSIRHSSNARIVNLIGSPPSPMRPGLVAAVRLATLLRPQPNHQPINQLVIQPQRVRDLVGFDENRPRFRRRREANESLIAEPVPDSVQHAVGIRELR